MRGYDILKYEPAQNNRSGLVGPGCINYEKAILKKSRIYITNI